MKTLIRYGRRMAVVPAAMLCLLAAASCGNDNLSSRNHPPVITSMLASATEVAIRQQVSLLALISDADGDTLTSTWTSTAGIFLSTGLDSATWRAPDTAASAVITFQVDDGKGGRATGTATINVDNRPPVITGLTAAPQAVFVSNMVRLKVTASDPDGGKLTYTWSDGGKGRFIGATADSAHWMASSQAATVDIQVVVSDPLGATATRSVPITVSGEVGSIWIANTHSNEVVKMSSDGSLVNRIFGFNQPGGIAVNPVRRHIWVADFGNNRVRRLDNDGAVLSTVDSLREPHAVAVYNFNGDAWIAQERADSAQIVKVDANGKVLARYSGFLSPRSLAVDQRNGNVWISDTGNNRVIRLDAAAPNGYSVQTGDQFHQSVTGFSRPMGLSVNSSNGDCFVADKNNNRVVHIKGATLALFIITGLTEPEALAVNRVSGELWVADTGKNRILKFIPELFTLLTGYNVNNDAGFHDEVVGYTAPILQPFAIAVNTETGNVWFAEQARVIKANPSMIVVQEVSGFNTPKAMAVNTGL